MSQTSFLYLIFLALVGFGYYALRKARWQNGWLLLCSYLFYASWQPLFCVLLFVVSLFTYGAGLFLASRPQKAQPLLLGWMISILLTPLFLFKYFNGWQQVLLDWWGYLPPGHTAAWQPLVIPLGISFFTFVAIGYLIDIKRGYLQPEKNWLHFATFLAFFPTIMAGPIERAKSMLPQLKQQRLFAYENVQAGAQLILWGFFKKIVIADRLNYFINGMYEQPSTQPGIFIYLAIMLSGIQIFCDFSAYSDIAVGTGRMLGIQVSKNFHDRVYAAPSREIFWKGWHRSLTSWLRDYVFFPLSKGNTSKTRLYANLMMVYLLVGLWHGASWGFVAWGLLNGLWLVGENASKKWRLRFFSSLGINTEGRIYHFCGWLLVFHAGAFIGLFFRTTEWTNLVAILKSLGNSNQHFTLNYYYPVLAGALLFTLVLEVVSRQIPANQNMDAALRHKPKIVRWIFYVLLSVSILRFFEVYHASSFLYYNF